MNTENMQEEINSSLNPVQDAYDILRAYMDGSETNEYYVIETALGYLGEALA